MTLLRPDPNTASEEEVYRFVRQHLLTQGERSMSGGVCAYRGTKGRSCAVGCLIPDDKYDASLEGRTTPELRDRGFAYWPKRLDALLCRLQAIHDGHDAQTWGHALDELATENGWTP